MKNIQQKIQNISYVYKQKTIKILVGIDKVHKPIYGF